MEKPGFEGCVLLLIMAACALAGAGVALLVVWLAR